jgi:hypothetical protein
MTPTKCSLLADEASSFAETEPSNTDNKIVKLENAVGKELLK